VAKISKAPKNFYTAEQAIRRLKMPKTTFFHYVRAGKIKKVVPPGQREGYYPKRVIDEMVRARELVILEYAVEPSSFTRATEEDIKGIHDLCVNLFGITETPSYETMLSWQQKNSYTYYVVKQEDIVTGYIGFLHLNEQTTVRIMSEAVPGIPIPSSTEVEPFAPGTPIHGLFVGLAVRPGLPPTQARLNGRHLITGAIGVLEDLARQNMPVKRLYATARTSDGVRLSRKLGFEETVYPNDPLIRFKLDLLTSDNPLLREYQQIVKRAAFNQARKSDHEEKADTDVYSKSRGQKNGPFFCL
jgi:hypothetical protein